MMTATQELPTEYVPRKLEEFYGPAKEVAKRIQKSAAMCMPRGSAASHLLVGPSGSGKSALAAFALEAFNVSQWNRHEVFGSDLSKEVVQELAFGMKLSNLYGGYRAYWFDEIDRCTKDARDRLLEIVGEKQPKETLIVATSNLSITEFDALEKTEDAKGRFSSRFQCHHVPGPTAEDIVALLVRWLPEKDAQNLARTAAMAEDGSQMPVNVRAVLRDCTTMLQQ
jgi:replication-associated recombination protein RarA